MAKDYSNSIVVTGAAGFIGARLVADLNQKNEPLISVDRLSYFNDRKEHKELDFGEKIDRDEFLAWLKTTKARPKAIFHMGACSDTTQLDLDYLRAVNVEYSQSLWTYATEHKIPFIYASSAATYGDGDQGYDDSDELTPKLKPLNPYGDSKKTFDVWALEQERKGHHPPVWSGFRFFNVYGFGERHKTKMSSVVLKAFDQIQASGHVKLFQSHKEGVADGEQRRDFIWVSDVVRVLWFAFQKPIARGIYNLGTGRAQTFLELVQAVFRALGKPESIEFIPTPEEIRDKYQYFTEAKMNHLRDQGYTEEFAPLEEGVKAYVEQLKQ